MANNNLITQALTLAVQYYEANGFTVDSRSVLKRIKDWYDHSDIADAEILAAAAIESEYECGADYDTILSWKDYYFPEVPVEYRGYISTEELRSC